MASTITAENSVWLKKLRAKAKPGGGPIGDVTTNMKNSSLARMPGEWLWGVTPNKVLLMFFVVSPAKLGNRVTKNRFEQGLEVGMQWVEPNGTVRRKWESPGGAVNALGKDFTV